MIREPETNTTSKFAVEASDEWSFTGFKSIDYLTHGYHRYPAKFIPHLVKKLIEEYTKEGDIIADVFAGCGTTLVEAKIHGRKSVGVDVNPVAHMITKAKTTAIEPAKVNAAIADINQSLSKYSSGISYVSAKHERIDYWFGPEEKNKIAFLYNEILTQQADAEIKCFLLCALSNILKNCSKWLQRGTKPQIDPYKKVSDPFEALKFQLKRMSGKNQEFHSKLVSEGYLNVECSILLADARDTSIETASVSAIITSPPYVTSYEYADIHQLTGYWFNYMEDLLQFRSKFIGTFFSRQTELSVKSTIAEAIVNELYGKDQRTAYEVANYFNDMHAVICEMKRILKTKGTAALVIGNTTLKNVRIKAAEAFGEMLEEEGFILREVIKRKIPNKINPTIRDKATGKFTKLTSQNMQLVYPEEFIIIGEKQS